MVILEAAITRINDEDLDLLARNIAFSEEQILRGKRPLDEHMNFHLLLAKASKNALFEMIIESIMTVTKSFLLMIKPDAKYLGRVLNYHKAIYKALKERNLTVAKKKIERHLLDANRKISELSDFKNEYKNIKLLRS
jgi:GntR family transcriptional repressor for pyruvate dehydrogenase complex